MDVGGFLIQQNTFAAGETAMGLLFLVFIIGLIGYHPDTRISLYVGCAWIVLLLVGWVFKCRRDRQLAEAQ